jgi:hypothetical protein
MSLRLLFVAAGAVPVAFAAHAQTLSDVSSQHGAMLSVMAEKCSSSQGAINYDYIIFNTSRADCAVSVQEAVRMGVAHFKKRLGFDSPSDQVVVGQISEPTINGVVQKGYAVVEGSRPDNSDPERQSSSYVKPVQMPMLKEVGYGRNPLFAAFGRHCSQIEGGAIDSLNFGRYQLKVLFDDAIACINDVMKADRALADQGDGKTPEEDVLLADLRYQLGQLPVVTWNIASLN